MGIVFVVIWLVGVTDPPGIWARESCMRDERLRQVLCRTDRLII
jgi:hypothetical protein